MVKFKEIPNKKKSLKEIKKREKLKKDYIVGLNKERTEKVKKYLEKEPGDKISFSGLMDYLLKQFYNQFKSRIEGTKKKE